MLMVPPATSAEISPLFTRVLLAPPDPAVMQKYPPCTHTPDPIVAALALARVWDSAIYLQGLQGVFNLDV